MINAKPCRICGVEKPLDCFHVLRKSKDGRQGRCKDCACAITRAWHQANKLVVKERKQVYYQRTKDLTKEQRAEWQRVNREKVAEYGKKYRSANVEKERARALRYREAHKAQALAYRQQYREANRDKLNLWDANRRAAEKRATPAWANHFFIAEAYHLAETRRRVCGGDWHVDHIVPIGSPLVCGLHVEANLRVIPGVENIRKSNRYWPDMP